MWKDKIVEQVRRNREKIFSEFDYDMEKYSKFIIEEQKKNVNRLITKRQLKREIA